MNLVNSPVDNIRFDSLVNWLEEDERDVEQKIDSFIQGQVPTSTTKKTKSDVAKLEAFLRDKNETRTIQSIPVREINLLLCEFIMSMNKENGEPYEISTYSGMRYSIERHLKAVNHPQADLSAKEYDKFRACLTAKMSIAKGAGKGNRPNRAMPLSEEDEEKLWSSGAMGSATGKSLLRALWWKFTTGFGLRGVQEHRDMQWGDVEVRESSEGTYIEFNERATKTRKGACVGRPFSPKIFCTCVGQCSEGCAVALFKLYAEKRVGKDHPAFYLAVHYGGKEDSWYKNQPLGNNSISNMMKEAAGIAGLEGNYTNHSGRKTSVKRLLDGNVAPQLIAQLTGHKNVASLSSYAEADAKMQKRMSAVVAGGGDSHSTCPVGQVRAHADQVARSQSMSTGASGLNFSGNFTGCSFYVFAEK